MKKFTILFATMMAMSGLAFGQVLPKLLWETKINTTDKLDYLSTAFCSKIGEESTLIGGNSFGQSAIDKDGNVIWNFPSITILGTRNFWTFKNDTLYRMDKESRIMNSPKIPFSLDFMDFREVEDGYIVMDSRTSEIIKWNFEGKEVWKYQLGGSIKLFKGILGSYFRETKEGYDFNYSFKGESKNPSRLLSLQLNKQGKEVRLVYKNITPLYQFGTAPVLTSDKGVWLHESPAGGIGASIMIRLDSANKEITQFYPIELPKIIGRVDAFLIRSTSGYSDLPLGITLNGALIYGFYTVDSDEKPKSLFFVKIDGVSKPIFTDEISLKERSIKTRSFSSELPTYVKVIDEDRFIFSISTGFNYGSTQGADQGIGSVNFKAKSLIWLQKIDSKVGIDQTYIANNSYGATITDKENSIPIIRNDSLICYSIDGKIKWSKAKVNQWDYLSKGENSSYILNIFGRIPISYIFDIKDSLTTKIRVSDGKELWTLKLKPAKLVSEDSEGNSFLYREEMIGSGRKYTLDFISKTGKIASIYQSPNVDFNQAGLSPVSQFNEYNNRARYQIDEKNKFFYSHALEKQSDGTYQFIYRKYSTRCAFDLEAIVEATGNTEACPTEKVKLSVPKQDGITYQWQKDGKDIPNVKDVVYDFGESGTYTVVAKDELCQNTVTSNALKINIRPLPTAEITAPKSIFCEGDKTVMAATTNGAFFQWQKDQKDIPKATTGIYEVSEAGNYRVGVRDDKCPQVGYSNVYTIITKLLPEANISTDIKGVVYEPFTVKMSANSGTNLAYQWLKDDAIIPNETKLIYEAKKSGKYNVIVTQDGCEKRSDALTISILIPLANSEEIGEEEVKVYPNPSKGEFKIILPKSLKSADIQLFDVLGRERTLVYVGEQAQAEGLTQGIYFVRIRKGEKMVTSKLIIE